MSREAPEPGVESGEPLTAPVEPFWRVWWRFVWPFLYFRDCTRGSWLERVQSYRHNRSMRRYLPGFILKWLVFTAFFFTFGHFFDDAAGLVIPAACCFVTGTWTGVVSIVLFIAWGWLERFPELY